MVLDRRGTGMSEQSEIDKAIPVGLWYGLTESQKRGNLSCDGSDVSGLTNDELDKVFLKNWGIEDDD